MAERYPGGVISKTPPTVTGPTGGEGGSASGVWTLDTVLEYEKAGAWPKPVLPRVLYASGGNSSGQLGDDTTVSRSSPVQVGTTSDWSAVSAGNSHTVSVKTDRTLWSFGSNGAGRLGDGTVINRSSPVQIGALTNWAQVSGAGNVTFGFTAAIKTDGTLWEWGSNSAGQLGDNTVISRSSPIQVGILTNWSQVSTGDRNAAAVKTDGTLWTWGRNNEGELGQNNLTYRSSPTQVGALTNWARVSIGITRTTASVKTDGTLWAWGGSLAGQIGDNTIIRRSSPVQVGALTNWSQVSVGNDCVLSVKTNNTLWAWGSNNNGQIGDGTVVNRSSPVQIGALTNWSQISGGNFFNASVKTDGTLWTWGRNASGELGDSPLNSRSSPVQVGALTTWTTVSVNNILAAITKG